MYLFLIICILQLNFLYVFAVSDIIITKVDLIVNNYNENGNGAIFLKKCKIYTNNSNSVRCGGNIMFSYNRYTDITYGNGYVLYNQLVTK